MNYKDKAMESSDIWLHANQEHVVEDGPRVNASRINSRSLNETVVRRDIRLNPHFLHLGRNVVAFRDILFCHSLLK